MKIKHLKKWFMLLCALTALLAFPIWGLAGPPVEDSGIADSAVSAANQTLSTPQLIEADLTAGLIDQDTANLYLAYAFADYDKLPAQYQSDVPWHGTLPMYQLKQNVQSMKQGFQRTEVEKLLTGSCSSSSGAMANVSNSTHFHVEYNTVSGGLSIGDYTTSLETTWDTEVTSFGWAAPPVYTTNPPPGNRYHVRIDNLGGGLYGFVSSGGAHAGFVGDNPNTAWTETSALASCMVLNDDYSGFPGSSQQALDATTAHEFNHSIQFGYGADGDSIYFEGGATWMEDEVFDNANDNYNYLWPTFTMCMGEYNASPYPYWITFRGLTERYGTGTAGGGEDIMQDFWEETSKGNSSDLGALSTAMSNAGTTLAEAYHAYAIAVKFNKQCGGGYTYPHCFEEGPSYVSSAGTPSVQGTIASIGGSYNGSVQDNYALNWVSLPTSGFFNISLENTSSGGQLRASLVCDTGSALNVTELPSVAGNGDTVSLTNYNPAGCNSLVAVITNESQTADNPASCTARSYTLSTSAATGGNNPPTVPHTPSPTDGASDVSINPILSWQGGDPDSDPVTYTVAFGDSSPPPVVATGQSGASYNPATLMRGTTYYWVITASDGMSASVGSEWSFSTIPNTAPTTPHTPSPSDGASGVSLNPTLSWQSGDNDGDPVSYTVAFGDSSPPPVVSSNQSAASYSPPALISNTTYYWVITASDGISVSVGPEWNFTTLNTSGNNPPTAPHTPSPTDGASDVSINPTLSWQGGDPDSDPVTYTVAFGNSAPPPVVVSAQSDASYTPPALMNDTTYYWVITATDGMSVSVGSEWSFTTESGASNIYLPLIIKNYPESQCIPIGESDNIADSIAISSGQTVCGQVSQADLDDVYKILASDGQQLTAQLTGTGGDADLYLYLPNATDIYGDTPVDSSTSNSNDELIQGTVSGSTAYWFVDVYSYSGTTDYELTVTVSNPKNSSVPDKVYKFSGSSSGESRRSVK